MSASTRQGASGTGQYSSVGYQASTPSTQFSGWVVFAATMMVLVGGFNIIDGLVALFNSRFYGAHYTLLLGNLQAWGWWSLIIGAVLVIAGLSIFTGSLWARIFGIVVAGANALAQLTFIAVYPIWALVIIGIDVVVIYALAVNREIE